MPKGQSFFKDMTKTQVEDEVGKIVDPISLHKEFESEFISGLIVEKHYFCSRNRLRPTKFRKLPGRNRYELEGYFPNRGWHKVSWRECIYPRNREKQVTEALRRAIEPVIRAYKTKHPVCEKCNRRPTEQIDHVNPEFKDIVKHALSLMTENDWKKTFDKFDWWNDAPFSLPEDSPSLIETVRAHKMARLQAVCKDCHLKNAEERRKA